MLHQIAGQIELMMCDRQFRRDSIPNCFQLKTDAGEALRQCVMHFMGKPFSFFHHSAEAPILDTAIEKDAHKSQGNDANKGGNEVACIPPGGTCQYLQVVGRTQQEHKGSEIPSVSCIHHTDTAQPQQAV